MEKNLALYRYGSRRKLFTLRANVEMLKIENSCITLKLFFDTSIISFEILNSGIRKFSAYYRWALGWFLTDFSVILLETSFSITTLRVFCINWLFCRHFGELLSQKLHQITRHKYTTKRSKDHKRHSISSVYNSQNCMSSGKKRLARMAKYIGKCL